MRSTAYIAPLLTLLLLLPGTAHARSHRVTQIPYGSNFGCTSCHTTPAGGGVFTGFGSDTILALVGPDLLQERDVDWSLVYQIDSDRDGFTNGEELNDPNGTWTVGQPNPIGGVAFNPGDASKHPLASCGDGRVTPPEECDGTNFREQSCIGLGLDEGTLVCLADCSFDRSGCGGGPPVTEIPTTEPPASDESADDAACSTTGHGRTSGWLTLLAVLTLAVRAGGASRRR